MDFAGKRRGMGLALYVIAAVLVVWGGYQVMRSWNWVTAEGKVDRCRLQTTGSGNGRTYTQHCDVTWTADGVTHKATVSFDGRPDRTGTTQKLRVSGGEAQAYEGRLGSMATAGLGVLLAGVGSLLRRRLGDATRIATQGR
ncbi:hypothetical protein AB0M47_10475 [Hamadaea sp. NPDC051192]|uniref:hypothetical protein n=1 Tax=Hamadaea sp. NPDC051192 TaxID=3154940 RepID=UPI0034456A53